MSSRSVLQEAADEVGLFDYDLPAERIAQEPSHRREEARMLVLPRDRGDAEHSTVADLPQWLSPGDCLVVNDSRVRPCRLFGHKRNGGGVEVLLLEQAERGDGEVWTALLRASRRPREGTELELEGDLVARVLRAGEGDDPIRLHLRSSRGESVEQVMERCGTVPLPPYIHRERHDPRGGLDRQRYQTVYAREPGSAAAPTAGLHLSPELLARLEERGIRRTAITLHVGIGTFQPVRARRLSAHRMHAEWCRVPEAAAEAIRRTRQEGGRVIAVGTTVVRTLEGHTGRAAEGPIDLFIRPGFRFQVVDGLLTNFHLPRSTLLALVAAFAGRERVLAAYRVALETGYRFYSYGDAMLVS